MNNICENFRQIIINSLEDIKNLKNKTIQKSDNSFVSEGDLLVQKLITQEIKENYSNYFLISEENDYEKNWKKCIGLLNFRKKIKTNNNYINIGLKGDTYEFAMKLDGLLSFKPINSSSRKDRSNELMW